VTAKLILTHDGNTIGEFELNKEQMTIGRKPENDIQIDNLAVSGQHAKIITILNDSFLEDMNSTNGTYVNFKRVKNHALKDQDIIMFKNYLIKFLQDPNVTLDHPTTEIPEDTVTNLKTWWSRRNEDQGKAQISVTVHQKGG